MFRQIANCKKMLLFLILLLLLPIHRVSAQSCTGLSAADCLGPANACWYNFANSTCLSDTSTDACQQLTTFGSCLDAGCFYDEYLGSGRCLTSLFQVQSVFGCSTWSQERYLTQTTQGLHSDACLYHGCVFNSPQCTTVTTGGVIDSNTTTSVYSQNVQFTNVSIVPNSFVMQLQIHARLIQSNSDPAWPTIIIRAPTASIGADLLNTSSYCSTFNASSNPQPFVALSGVPVNTTFISQNWNNFQFPPNDAGILLHKLLGYPILGNIVQSTSSDGQYITYHLQFDLNALVNNCSAAHLESTSDDRIYTIPIAYIDRKPNNVYYEQSMIFTVRFPTTGVITISSVTAYHQRAYPLEVVYPRICNSGNEAAMRIKWVLEVRDVFDAGAKVGPRNISDIVMRSPSSSGVINCYGDQVTEFVDEGCNSVSQSCRYTFITQSRCRSLTPDGEAFNQCSYAASTDRIADMGSDIAYPTTLDALHTVFAYVYTCRNQQCQLTVQSPLGLPDAMSAKIVNSEYPTADVVGNKFQVTAGFLSTPTSTIQVR
jgi:hypothetical protein